MKSFVQSGRLVTVPAPVDTRSGDFVVVGALFGIAASDALAGADLEVAIGGIYDGQPKLAAQAWTPGQAVYWDSAAKLFTSVAGSNLKVGVAALAAANPSAVGRVRLNGSF